MNLRMNLVFKMILKILISLVILFIICLVITSIVVRLYSPGKVKPFTDENGNVIKGSIREKVFVNIGGVRQGMIIEGNTLDAPVLLYVHGGPAFPNYFLIDKYKPGLEEIFTVCYWEQRGGGLSYSPEISIESMTFRQLTSDAIEVTNYLRKRFNKDKIYIIAHSGGTQIALKAVQKLPELFHAYLAMAQITNQMESEKIAYKYMLKQYQNAGNQKTLTKLMNYKVLDSDSNVVPFFKSVNRDKSMHELGIGTMHKMNSVFWDIFVPVWTCKAYTVKEKINIWKSKFSFLPKTNLINEEFATDYASEVTRLEVPVYFFSGKYDLTVNIDLSKAYLEKLQAPEKAFYLFENSAHSPLFEEPEKFKQIIIEEILVHDKKH